MSGLRASPNSSGQRVAGCLGWLKSGNYKKWGDDLPTIFALQQQLDPLPGDNPVVDNKKLVEQLKYKRDHHKISINTSPENTSAERSQF